MRLKMNDGTVVQVGVRYGEETLPLRNPAPVPHKKTEVKLTVRDEADEILAEYVGVSYCAPQDKYEAVSGRRLAMRRAFDQDVAGVLTKDRRKAVAKHVIGKIFVG